MSLPQPALELTQELGERLVDTQREWQPRLITGFPGTGKTLVLEQLAARAEQAGLGVVRISPPSADLDGPASALVQGAAGMGERGVNGVLDPIFDPRASFETKLQAFESGLRELPDSVIMLDLPDPWIRPSAMSSDGGTFHSLGHEVARRLFAERNGHRVVFAGVEQLDRDLELVVHRIARVGSPELLEGFDWGRFADAASSLAEIVGRERLERLTPLELRAAVALRALDDERACQGPWAELRRQLQDQIRRLPWLREALFVLSHVRIGVGRTLLDQLLDLCEGDDEQRSRALLEDVLLMDMDRGARVLHARFRQIDPQLGPDRARVLSTDAHRCLAAGWEQIAGRRSWAGVVAWWESLHHWAEAGEEQRLDDAPDVSMWTTLGRGRSLSGDYEAAVRAFRRAVELQPKDSYAHEYLAYNLDRCDQDMVEAERSFRRAVELDSGNPWWNRRLIEALQRRGKIEQAHAAWLDALEQVEGADVPEPWLQHNLHLGVARGFLDHGQTELAAAVVEAVPKSAWIPEFRAVWNSICHRREAVRLEAAVFPEGVDFEHRWRGPRLGYSEPQRWFPGRVIAVDEDEVELELAEPPERGGDPVVFGLTLERAAFFEQAERSHGESLRPGLFVEVHVYADGSQRIFIDDDGSFARRGMLELRRSFDLLGEFRR